MSPRISRDRKEEILGLLVISIGVLSLLSLMPQWLSGAMIEAPEGEYTNLVGLAGKLMNESLKDLFGVLAYGLPVLLVAWGWRLFRGKPSPVYSRLTTGVVFIGLGSSMVVGLFQRGSAQPPLDFSGGLTGSRLAEVLVAAIGPAGAYLVTILTLIILIMLYTGLSLRSVTEGLINVCRYVSSMLKKAAAASRRKKAVAKKAKKPQKDKKKPELEEKVSAGPEGKEAPESFSQQSLWNGEDIKDTGEFDFDLGPALPDDEHEDKVKEQAAGREQAAAATTYEQGEEAVADYELPSIDILDEPPEGNKKVVSREELEKMGRVLIAKLGDFNVQGELINITRGPQVSTFEIRPAPGVKVNRISSLADDLAMVMHAKRVRILAPVPGKGVVGVELPNPVLELVTAREVIESRVFRDSNLILPLCLGKDLEGKIRVADLAAMPHLLIAGTTGSGKSVCMNMIIASLLFRHGPESVRVLMLDPKMIELSLYNDIPHLLHPVVTERKDAARILKWAVLEMERRYRTLSLNSVRNIEDYNVKIEAGKPVKPLSGDEEEKPGRMPYEVILVDELSDLMSSDVRNEIETSLVRLAQMARAVGIHLVVATQRPSVDVITGLIKANFPTRLSFQVYSKIDSRTILDLSGAEQLLRNGDMLFIPAGQADPIRIQGAFISSEETERLVMHWRSQLSGLEPLDDDSGEQGKEPQERQLNILEDLDRIESAGSAEDEEHDELFNEAARLVIRHNLGSTSLIQRRLKVGYARAGRIVDQLERAGILGPPDGSRAREVLITEDELPHYEVE
ncbi:MAG: DNA translocase FtsK 4TM domain-containing protein [Gemmatimonadota bacterium]|nr:DNA translocase FtsK 4TM domain-containing protein [Gemmatimonadota bacterium]